MKCDIQSTECKELENNLSVQYFKQRVIVRCILHSSEDKNNKNNDNIRDIIQMCKYKNSSNTNCEKKIEILLRKIIIESICKK